MKTIVARIQGHPSRASLHERLLEHLHGLPARVSLHSSDPPNPWAGYQRALRSGLEDPTKPTHVLVLQDDVEVCRNFTPAVERIVESKPDDCVSLYLSYLPRPLTIDALQALKARKCYSRARSAKFWPVLAVIWPRPHAEHFLEWTSTARLPGHPNEARSDDAVFGEWGRRNQVTLWITCPSLVEHPDREPSLIGRRALWGKDKGRRAFQWIGQDADPLELDW